MNGNAISLIGKKIGLLGALLLFCLNLRSENDLQEVKAKIDFNAQKVEIQNIIKVDAPLDTLGFKIILPPGIIINRVEASIFGKNVLLSLPNEQEKNLFIGNVLIPAALSGDTMLPLTISYKLKWVNESIRKDVWTFPIAYIDIKPQSSPADFFNCLITLDPPFRISPIFPNIDWMEELLKGRVQYQMNMQVIPGWLKFKLVGEQEKIVPITLFIDILVVSVLLLFLIIGGRQLINQN